MAHKTALGKYLCSHCLKEYDSPSKADACRDSHDLVYIPMTKTELNRLVLGLFQGDLSVIPQSLHKTLKKYQKIHGKD